MNNAVQPGDRVHHPEFGPGVVLGVRAGRQVRVRFDQRKLLPYTVDEASLSLNGRAGELSASVFRNGPPDDASDQAADLASNGDAGDTGDAWDATPAVRERPAGSAAADPAGAGPAVVRRRPPRPRSARKPRAGPKLAVVRPPLDAEEASVRQTLEALRLGVVPSVHVADYTVGRDPELESVQALLEAARGLRLVWGDYGTGKTHILDLAEQAGLRAGFVTARAVLNPREVPPTHPQRLYRTFLVNFRYPDSAGTGWWPLLSRLESSSDHVLPGGRAASRFLSPVLHALQSRDPEAIDWATDYIEGYGMDSLDVTRALRKVGWRGQSLLTLSNYRTYGRMYVHLIGTLACWARDAGYRGLLLLMDEVEYVEALTCQHRDLAEQVLKHYAAATLPEDALAFPLYTLYRGGQEVHRRLSLLFRSDQPLAVMMAMTPLAETQAMVDGILRDETTHLRLTPLGASHFSELVRRVVALYERGYASQRVEPGVAGRLRRLILDELSAGIASPRDAVRTVVAFLDGLRYGRDVFGESAPGRIGP